MKKDFKIRRDTLNTYFQSQMNANLEKSLLTDGLFNFTYLVLNTEMPILEFPSSNERISELIPLYRIQIEKLYDTAHTRDVKHICMNIVELVQSIIQE